MKVENNRKNKCSVKPVKIFRYLDSLYDFQILSSESKLNGTTVRTPFSSILRYKNVTVHCTSDFTMVYSGNKCVTIYRDLHEEMCNTLYYTRISLAFDRALRNELEPFKQKICLTDYLIDIKLYRR